MPDAVTYFALHPNGKLIPIGDRNELCDEIVEHVIERGEWMGDGVSLVRVDLPHPVDPPAPQFAPWILVSFGASAIVGAITIARWIWLAAGLVI